MCSGFVRGSGKKIEICISPSLPERLVSLGLSHVIGFLRFSKHASATFEYVPFHVFLGIPLAPLELCIDVCALARESRLIEPSKSGDIISDQHRHEEAVDAVMRQFGQNESSMAPRNGFFFDGKKLQISDTASSDIISVLLKIPSSSPRTEAVNLHHVI